MSEVEVRIKKTVLEFRVSHFIYNLDSEVNYYNITPHEEDIDGNSKW